VKIDIGEVLTRAWQISWKNKGLWWFGIFLGLFVLVIFPLMIVPISFPFFLRDQRMDLFLLAMAGLVVVFLVFFAIMYLVSAVFQTALTLGVLRAVQDEEQIPLIELIRNSMPFFLRVLGVMVLYAVAVTMVNLVIQAIVFLLAIVTFGVGMLCATPLSLLQYPVIFVAVAWMEQAVNGVVIHKMTALDAVKQGWQIVRNNLLTVGLVIIVVYFGISMVSMIVVMPMMTPLFILPFGFLEGEPNWIIIAVSLLFGAAFIPLYALLTGWSAVFTKSAWVLTYLRLTHPTESQPILQETTV
jgi:hypothetical protein